MYATSKLIIPPKISRDSPYVPKIRICLRPSPSLDKNSEMGTSLGSDQVLREDTSHSDHGVEQQDHSVSCEDQRLPAVGDRPSKPSGKQKSSSLDFNKLEGPRSSRKRKSLASFDNIDLERRDSILTKISLKNLINKENFEALPLESKRKLIQLLPIYDRVRPPPGISLGDEAGEVAKTSHCDGNASDGDTTATSVPRLWIHPTALNNEFLSKALQDYSARQLNGEFAPRQNGRSGLRKTVGNRSRYAGLPVSPLATVTTTVPVTTPSTTNTSSSFQNGTPKPASVSTPLSPSPGVHSFPVTATATVNNSTRDETDTLSEASAGIDQAWESVPKAGSASLFPGLHNNDLGLDETAIRPDKNLPTETTLPTLPSPTAAVGTIASSVSSAGNRKGTNGVKKTLTKGQLKQSAKAEMEEKGQPADLSAVQRITTRLSRKRKASAPAAAAAAAASPVVCETKEETVLSNSTSSSPSRPGMLLLPSKLFRIGTRQRRRFSSVTTSSNRPASLADDELDDDEEADEENEGPHNATQSPSTTTTSEGYSPVELENRKLFFSPADATATASSVVSGKGKSSRIDWPTKPTANAVLTPSRRLNSCQDAKTTVFSTPRGSTSKSAKDREVSIRVKSELGSSQPSTLEMPPPRQTKTLASVREKLRAKRMLLENQRSSPHPPLGSLTPNPGLSHTGNFYSSPFYRQPSTVPSTVSSSCLSSSQLTALNIDAQFPSQPPTQQSSGLSKFTPPPPNSVASAIESLDTLSQNMASSLDLFTSKTVILPQQQPESSSSQLQQQQLLQQQQQPPDAGFPQSVSAPATPHHERHTDRIFAPRSTISTPAGSRALSSQASPISTSQSTPSINSKVVQLFSNLRQARLVLAPSCSVSNSSLSSDVEVAVVATSATVSELEVSPPLTASANGTDARGSDDAGTVGCAGQSFLGARPNSSVPCTPSAKVSPLQPAVTVTAAPAANGTATTRAFFVDGNNLSETLALLQSMNPQATVTQQQFLLIPSSDRSFMYLWRTPLSGCLKSVQQPVQHQLHPQVQQTQVKLESIELPTTAGPPCVVSSSASVLPEVTAKADSSGRPTVVSYPSLVQTKHQQPSVDVIDGRRSSLTLPLILPATLPPTSLPSSSRGLVSDLPASSQPQLKPSVTAAAAAVVVSHAPMEPSSGYREILPSPVEGKTLITNSRPAPASACSSTGLVMQSSASRLPQLAPNDQRRVGLFYQQQHHVDVIPGPQPRQPQQQHPSTPASGTTTTTTTTFILNTSGGTPVSLVERNIVISSNHLRSLPAGVTAFPVSFQPTASAPPPPPPPSLPVEQHPTALTSAAHLVAQPLQPKENPH